MITIKNEDEIRRLRKTGKIHATILKQLAQAVRGGLSTADLDSLAHTLVIQSNSRPALLHYTPAGAPRPYPATTCISINEEVVHGIPNEQPKIMHTGDIVSIDISIEHDGMFTDAAVTVAVGPEGPIAPEAKELDPIAQKLLMVTKRALDLGIAAAIAGKHVGDIGYAIERYVKDQGFVVAEDLCGHGVGKKVHEDPYVPNSGERGQGELLWPGMVLAIEPMVNEGTSKIVLMADGYTYRTADKKRSAHFEHTVLITEKSPEILTKE